jgi:hypothetical protein
MRLRMQDTLQRSVSLTDVFRFPTIRQPIDFELLVEWIRRVQGAQPSP